MITLLVLASLYFLPTLIASHRGHSVTGILLLNFFFGWTGVGWFALLLWALLSRPPWLYYPYRMIQPLDIGVPTSPTPAL